LVSEGVIENRGRKEETRIGRGEERRNRRKVGF